MPNPQLERLKELAQLLDDSLSREEFFEMFNKVISHIKRMEPMLVGKVDFKISEEQSRLLNEFKKETDRISKDSRKETKDNLKNLKKEMKALSRKISDVLTTKNAEIDERLSLVRDGKDADEDSVIEKVLQRVPIPKVDDTKLESLKGELFAEIARNKRIQTSARAKVNMLGDVSLTSLADNEILQYDSASGLWKNEALGAGTGTMTTVKEGGVQLGGADIVTLDFDGDDFNLTESPDTEVNITIADASATVAGLIELATDAETNTGTATDRAVTPANVTAWTGSTNVTTLGTIATGTWQGTAVDGAYVDIEGTEIKSTGEAGGTKFLREDGDGTCSWQTPSGTGDVVGDTASADKELVRFNGTGGKTIESPVTDNASVTATLSDNVDLTLYDATNDGNPVFAFGATSAERLTITPTYDSGAQTLDYVEFATAAASATADKGEYRFNVDGTLSTTIDDGGVEIKASGSLSFGAVDILTDSGGTTTLNNIDALDATTENTIEAAIDTLANLTAASALVTVGALNSGSISTGFGNIDNGASTITTTGDITGGGIHVTGDTAAGDNAALGYTATEGLILAGQGSTADITIKNDADNTVLQILTGTTDVTLGVDGTASDLILTEKSAIRLDPAGGADGDYTGITFVGTAGATVAFGDVVYLDSADSEWKLADADAASTSGSVAIAICVSSGTDGGNVTLMTHGIIRADAGFPALTVGAPVYISTTGTTTNTVTVTAPSGADDVVRVVGFGLTANEMMFTPSPDHITVTG